MKCTVVVPTYNELDNIEQLIGQVLAQSPDIHVLVVDDNSPDGTGELVDRLAAAEPRIDVLHRPGKAGLGTAYMEGLAHALANGSEYVAQMDADFSHDPSYLPVFLKQAVDANADVVIGTRYDGGGAIRNWPLARHLLSRVGNFYARMLLGSEFTDYTSGFMLHRASALRQLPFRDFGCTNFAFLLELKSEYRRRGLVCSQVPIEFVNRTRGSSKISLAVVFEAFRIVLQISRRTRREGRRAIAVPAPEVAEATTVAASTKPQQEL